jgi:hypothetical protein
MRADCDVIHIQFGHSPRIEKLFVKQVDGVDVRYSDCLGVTMRVHLDGGKQADFKRKIY